jgi:polysaccharide biosynthesis transport protein
MKALLRQWRTEYDYIVIDAPPVLSVTDAAVLAPMCAAIVVVRAGVTSKKSLMRVRDIFARTRTRMLGTILNSFDVRSADYRSHAGYESTPENENGYYIAEAS